MALAEQRTLIVDSTGELPQALPRILGIQPDQIGQVARSRFFNHNAPVIAGTRIPVSAIRDFVEAGYTIDKIIEEYPDLTDRDAAAALTYQEADAAA